MFNFFLMLLIIFAPLVKKSTVWLNLGYGFNITNIILVMLILVWLFERIVDRKSMGGKNPLAAPILLLGFTVYCSLWVGYNTYGLPPFGDPLEQYKRFMTPFLLIFLSTNVKNQKSRKFVLGMMILMMTVESYVTLVQHYEHPRYHFDEAASRLGGTFYRSNELGTFFAMYIPILLSCWFFSRKIINKAIFAGLSILNIMALLWTYSREAYVALIGGIAIIGLLKNKQLIPLILLLLVFASAVLPPSVYERLVSIKDTSEDISVNTRYEMWRLARFRIKESPILGHGYGTSRFLLPRDTHNMYYDMAMESGIPAVLILLWFFNRTFFVAVRLYSLTKNPVNKIISLSAVAAVTAMAICNVFGTRLNFAPINMYFGILVGMMLRAKMEEERSPVVEVSNSKTTPQKAQLRRNQLYGYEAR